MALATIDLFCGIKPLGPLMAVVFTLWLSKTATLVDCSSLFSIDFSLFHQSLYPEVIIDRLPGWIIVWRCRPCLSSTTVTQLQKTFHRRSLVDKFLTGCPMGTLLNQLVLFKHFLRPETIYI